MWNETEVPLLVKALAWVSSIALLVWMVFWAMAEFNWVPLPLVIAGAVWLALCLGAFWLGRRV
jgi:hypothetical protein